MMRLTTRTKKSASKQAIAVLIKRCFVFTVFLIHLQNFIVNQIIILFISLPLEGAMFGREGYR